MEEKELTNEEIIKALDCMTGVQLRDCEKCPFMDGNFCDDFAIARNALDLIHRLKSENTEYKRKLEDGELVSKDWHDEQVGHAEIVMEEQKAEIERLTEENEVYYFQWQNAQTYNKNHEEIWARNTRQVEKEKAELQKQVDELKARDMSEMRDLFNAETDRLIGKAHTQAVKDTAKEILQSVGDIVDDGDDRFKYKDYQWHKRLCERYGVEVD